MAKVADEQIVAALLACGSIRAAAANIGVTERTIYDRMKSQEFKFLYEQARADVLRSALSSVNGKLTEALETVAAIMKNDDINPATRLQAAQTIINAAAKFSDHLYRSETRAEGGMFSFMK